MKKRKTKNNLPKEEWGSILRYFGGRRNEMYQWIYDNVPHKYGAIVKNGQLAIVPHKYRRWMFGGIR